jgi:hypothetical protein
MVSVAGLYVTLRMLENEMRMPSCTLIKPFSQIHSDLSEAPDTRIPPLHPTMTASLYRESNLVLEYSSHGNLDM